MKQKRIKINTADTFSSKYREGDIEISEWMFKGIKLNYFDGQSVLKTTRDLNFENEGVILCFDVEGKTIIKGEKPPFKLDFTTNQHNTFYYSGKKLQIYYDSDFIKLFVIYIPEKVYFDICGTNSLVQQKFNAKADSKNVNTLFDQNLTIDFLLRTCLSAILKCNYEDSLKSIFLFSKVVEIIVLQLESYKNSLDDKKTYIKTDYDKERILYAKDYLLKNIENPPSIKQLARVSGINEFKLKKGFKELFSQTVYEYLSDVRLDLAKNDLLESKKSISQIAFDLGYSSLQHFSNSFKKKFGVSPNQVR